MNPEELPGAPSPADAALERMRAAALAELSRAPVARPWWKDAFVLAGVNLVVAAACSVALGMRGLALERAAPAVLVAVGAPIVLMLVFGAIAAVMPARRARLVAFAVVAAVTAGAVALGGGGEGASGGGLWAVGRPCLTSELVISVVPTAAAILVLSRFAYSPLRMFLGGLAGGAAGLFALHLHCPVGSFGHLAGFHVLPWIAAAGLSVLIRARVRSRSFAP